MRGTTTSPPDLSAQFAAGEAVFPRPLRQRRSRVRQLLERRGWFLLFVVLPTLLTAIYYYGIAAKQYKVGGSVYRARITVEWAAAQRPWADPWHERGTECSAKQIVQCR